MYELKKIGTVLTSKSVVTGPSSYEKRIYRAAVSQSLRNTGIKHRRCCLLVTPHPGHQQAAPSVHYTTSCKHSLALLRMGETVARNMLS